jgi:hypothetical protein
MAYENEADRDISEKLKETSKILKISYISVEIIDLFSI